MQTITATDSMNRAYRAAADKSAPQTFAKPGETQAAAVKRFMSALKREKALGRRTFPAFKLGMSTSEYVSLYEAFHSSQSGLKGRGHGFWSDLNCDPATLYAGESFDFAPIVEDCADEATMLPDAPIIAAPMPDPAPAADPAPEPAAIEPDPAVDAPAPRIVEMAQDAPTDPIAWQISAARPTTIYATPVARIGVHEWCMVVYAHCTYAACTDQLWRRVDSNAGRFFSSREWPTYDSNRTHSGLPISIGRKVYDPNRAQIQRALEDAQAGILPTWASDDIRSTLRRGIDARAREAESLQILREQREMVARVRAQAEAAAAPAPIAAEPAFIEPEPIACTPPPVVGEKADAEESAFHWGAFEEMLRLRREREARELAAVGDLSGGGILRNDDGRRYAMILPDVDGGGKWRIQRFDAAGFSGHMVFAGQHEATAAAIGERFKTRDDGALDALASRPEWARGMFVCDLAQRMNGGMLDWREANRLIEEYDLQHAAPTPSPAVVEMRNEAPAAEPAQIIVPTGWPGCKPDLSQNRPDARKADAGARSWVSDAGLGWRDARRRAGAAGRRSALPPTWRGADAMRRHAARCGMAQAPPPAWGKCAPTANRNERRAS